MKYRKKPVVIEATQWFKNGDHPLDDSFCLGSAETGIEGDRQVYEREGKIVRYFRRPNISGEEICKHCGKAMHEHGWIDTLEGGHIVCPGDYIITGVKGEHYPCKPDIFEQTYEAIDIPDREAPLAIIPVEEALEIMRQGEILYVNEDHDEVRWNENKRTFEIRFHDADKTEDWWFREGLDDIRDYTTYHRIGNPRIEENLNKNRN
jgi:hypothetical protein